MSGELVNGKIVNKSLNIQNSRPDKSSVKHRRHNSHSHYINNSYYSHSSHHSYSSNNFNSLKTANYKIMSKSNESIASTSNSAKKSGNGGFLKNLTAEPAESTKQKTNQVQKMQQNELNDLLKLKEAALANKNKSQKAKYNSFSKPIKSNTVQKRASPIKHSACTLNYFFLNPFFYHLFSISL